MKMIDHNHFICHLILGTFTEYPFLATFFYFITMFFQKHVSCQRTMVISSIRCLAPAYLSMTNNT